MSTIPPDFSAPIINSVHEVASRHLGKSLVKVFRNCFSITDSKVREGDHLLGRSSTLIRQYYEFLPFQDQETISAEFDGTTIAKERLKSARGSRRQKFALAKDFKQRAEHLFIIVQTASNRAQEVSLRNQILRANAQRAPQPPAPQPPAPQPPAPQPPAFGTTSSHTDPFSDSHEAALADVNVNDLNEVRMSVFESRTSGEAAVVLGLHGRDGRTQEISTTIPLEVISGDRTEGGSRVARWVAETAAMGTHSVFGSSEASTEVGR